LEELGGGAMTGSVGGFAKEGREEEVLHLVVAKVRLRWDGLVGGRRLTSMMTRADLAGSIVMGVVVVRIVMWEVEVVVECVRSKPFSEEYFQALSSMPMVAS
jgi:hypothetical protein